MQHRNTATTKGSMTDYLQLSDSAFNKAIDSLNSDAYRALVESNPDVRGRINGNPAWIERRDQRELEALVTKDLQNKKDRLNAELRTGRGLSATTWTWLDERNIPTVSLSVMPALKEIKPAYLRLDEKCGPFTEPERAILVTVAQQCCEIGRVLDLRTDAAWFCAYHVAIASGKIGWARTKPVEKTEPTMAERISQIAAPPTPEEQKAQQRHDYFNKVVGTWTVDAVTRNETAATVYKMDSETYKQFMLQTTGKLERSFSNLLHPVPMGVK